MFLKKSPVYFLKPTGQKLNSNFNHSCSPEPIRLATSRYCQGISLILHCHI
nr:MAG TPA: hypothetical protein [Caudoviricetes sp.]